PLGRGGVWLEDDLHEGETSDPFLFSGFQKRGLHLSHDSEQAVLFTLEVDRRGNGEWTKLRDVDVAGYRWLAFSAEEQGEWIRVRVSRKCVKASAFFHYSNPDPRGEEASQRFDGIAKLGASNYSGGLLRTRGENL